MEGAIETPVPGGKGSAARAGEISGLSKSSGNSSEPLLNISLPRTRPSFSSPLKGGDEKDEFATGASQLVLEDEIDEKDEFASSAAFWLSG